MDLSEIKQYPHKIFKIEVNNQNDPKASIYDTAMLKVTISETKENEIIVFSYDEELNTHISCTQNGHDYFLTIANVEGITNIYAHVLMSDLYDETNPDNSDTFVEYDLSKIGELDEEYKTLNRYHESYSKHPQISSKLEDSEDKNDAKNPNYKQYNTDTDKNNKRFQDRFPIASRYASNEYNKSLIAPRIIQEESMAKFTKGEYYKNDDGQPLQGLEPPTWEVYIPREDIGDVIPKDTDTNQYPVNVYLNYEYLPSTTEYHQHFYGFEANNKYTDVKEKNRQINVFEGSNLETINRSFFNDDAKEKYTYRLINVGNKSDHTNAKDFQHTAESIPLLDYTINNESCEWRKNNCDKYYIYTAKKSDIDRGLYYSLELEPDTSYILKYYIFIPSNVQSDDEDCSVKVQYVNDASEVITIGEVPNMFKKQDRLLSNQWVYHEIPFRTTQVNNRIYIKGHKDVGKDVFFGKMELLKTIQYSPTIKYTNQGVFVVENDISINKPNKDYNNKEHVSVFNNNTPFKEESTTPDIPYNDFYVDFKDNFDVSYNTSSKILSYYPNDGYSFKYEKNEGEWNLYFILDDSYSETITPNTGYEVGKNIEYSYETLDEITNEPKIISFDLTNVTDDTGEHREHRYFSMDYTPKQLFTYGTNNKFELEVSNEHQVGLNTGYVECAITSDDDESKDIKSDSIKYLGKKYISKEGKVNYTRIDFSDIPKKSDNTYFLRIHYYHPCYDDVTYFFKKVLFTEENLAITIKANNQSVDKNTSYTVHHVDEFPFEIKADVHQAHDNSQATDWGYCEMSINEKVVQTNYVNINGEAVFYLNPSDLQDESQVIKIEYYRKYNEVKAYEYFTLIKPSDFEGRDAVPIRFNVLDNNNDIQTANSIVIDKDDCLIIDVDINNIRNQDINYSIRLYKNNILSNIENSRYINIRNVNDENNLFIMETYDNSIPLNTEITYKIVTDSLIDHIDENGTIHYANTKYREYSKDFKVTWR